MKLHLVSLGCDKNLVDAEHMLGQVVGDDFSWTGDPDEADVIVVNTCCFIDDAKEESIGAILEMANKKAGGSCRALIVTGCMAERYREEIFTEIPEVDAILGTGSRDHLSSAIRDVLAGEKKSVFEPVSRDPIQDDRRVLTTGGHYAYLKIAEGCDKRCTYCVIPSLRGHYRSVPPETLLAEAVRLSADGVRELILVAQETTLYGTDLAGRKMLPDLLEALCGIADLAWIRVLYCYPEEIDSALLRVVAEQSKICPALELPVQHVSTKILRRMGRHATGEEIRRTIRRIREAIPGIALRTTLMTGFPGETEEDHAELLDFVKEMRFDRLGVFAYSQEEGTPASRMPGQIPEEIKQRRREELLLAQQEISAARGRARIGMEEEVLIEGFLPEEKVYVGRTRSDAPDVDGLFFLSGAPELMTGEIVRARVTGATEYDLMGDYLP